MLGAPHSEQEFTKRMRDIVEANFHNEQFGVIELATKMGKSRSYLHRHLKKITNQSVSQFIRTIRLEKAMELLLQNDDPASEVAYKVGFGSPAYFNHCFHEHYGYPPGEVRKKIFREEVIIDDKLHNLPQKSRIKWLHHILPSKTAIVFVAVILTVLIYVIFKNIIVSPEQKQVKFEKSIIVLPFKNFTNNQDNQYLADGITEDILNNLYRISALRIVSRTSADRFRESNYTIGEIAKLMKVNYVLEGSIRRYENDIRISVQLIDAQNDNHLWSENFDRELENILGIQGDIAIHVADHLNALLSEKEKKEIERISTIKREAYDYYLRARFLLHKANGIQRADFKKEGVINCIQYYEKAIEADSMFAEAYSGLANAWFNLSAWGFLNSLEGFQKAKVYSSKALTINPDCAEAHAVLGAFYIWPSRNIETGIHELKTSLELNPHFSTAHQWYAQALMITGPIEEARKHVNRALELEPYFWVTQTLSAWIYYFEEEYEKAINDCSVARDLNNEFIDNKWLFVLNYAKLNEGDKMVNELQSIVKKYSGSEDLEKELQGAYIENGINGVFSWLIEVNKTKPVPVEGMNGHPFYIAWWYAILNNNDEAVLWLERTLEEKQIPYHYFNLIATNPDFDILREDFRFIRIIDKAGLTAYHKRKSKTPKKSFWFIPQHI